MAILSKLAPFPRPFWVINGVELFERGAYYGMLSILSVFIATDLQFPPWLTGVLLAVQFPLLYFLPVFSGALADKLGFKRLLIATFVILIAGYLVLSIANNFATGLIGIVLYGIGAGLFKPMPAATVSDTTSEQDRNFGFSIYYWMINLGAFVAPLAMQQVFGGTYRSYFVVSAALSALNLIICLTLWKDLRPRDASIKVSESLKRVGEIRKYPSFMVLILIYSGFWFMYAITTSYLQIYALDQGILSPGQVAILVPANALAILIVGPILGKLTGKLPSLPLMIAGIMIFCSGFLLIGFVPFLWATLAGIFIYSIGEFMTHPSYLAYVTKISPPDRVPVFLGYGFIAIGIGQFAGTLSGGFLYQNFARDGGRAQMFWVAIVSVGLLTVAALAIYNMLLTRRLRPAGEPKRSRGFAGPVAVALALLLIPALVVAGSLTPAMSPAATAGLGNGPLGDLVPLALAPLDGTSKEKETLQQTVTLPANATGFATFTLTWKDEAPSSAAYTNAPDSFKIHVTAPNGTMVGMSKETANPSAGEGKIELKIADVTPGDWVVTIESIACGDQTAGAGLLALPAGQVADSGNAWTLTPTVQATRG